MNTPRFSIVMPVYNVEAYLPACLESLAAMTPPADEIIAVDDGATDGCPAILAAWQERLPQMRIIRQDNAGLSAARNTGMAHATGTWLAFVDSDDMVQPDAHARLLALAEVDRLDMVIMNADYHFEGRQPDYPIYRDVAASPVMTGSDWLKERLKAGRLLHMVWMHVYRREFLTSHQFQFVPDLIHEDVIWTTEALLAAQRVRFDPTPGYRYRIPIRHFTQEQQSRRLAAIIASSIYNARALDGIAETLADEELRKLMRYELVDKVFAAFHKVKQLPRSERRRHYGALRTVRYFGLLWRNASGTRQYRRIAGHWLRSLWQ